MARLHEGRWSSHPMALVRRGCQVLPWDPTPAHLRKFFSNIHLGLSALSIVIALASWCVPSFGQTDVNDVHVQPREVEKPAEPAKPDLVASTTGMSAHVRPLKVDVDLVLVPVTITDPMNRLVTGLDKENFQLFEGNASQQIRTFSSEDAPVSLGVIFDSSGSMSSKMDRAKDAVIEFFKTANPQDEFFMITFSDEPEAVSDFNNSYDQIFLVEQNRDAQMRSLLVNECGIDPARFISVLNYDGTPITARFIIKAISERLAVSKREAAE